MGNGDEAAGPLLQKADFTAYLTERAQQIAPRDVEVLLADAERARERALADPHPRLGPQMIVALDLLRDHALGNCPQIPFYTVSLLAEAVYYYLDPNDVIPDWIPRIGKLDDLLVMEIAFELGAEGIQRYCDWKGIDDGAPEEPRAEAATATKKAKRTAGSKKVKGAARSKVKGAARSKVKSAAAKKAKRAKAAAKRKPASEKRSAKKSPGKAAKKSRRKKS